VSTVDSVTTDHAYKIEKAKKELGYRPSYELKKGVGRDRKVVQG